MGSYRFRAMRDLVQSIDHTGVPDVDTGVPDVADEPEGILRRPDVIVIAEAGAYVATGIHRGRLRAAVPFPTDIDLKNLVP